MSAASVQAIRIIFRFLFAVPLLILAIDGIRPHEHVNESLFGTGKVLLYQFCCVQR